GAVRRAEERHGPPAARAQLPLAADRGAAREAARRQQEIEHAAGGAAQPARREGERNHRWMTARDLRLVNHRPASGFAASARYGHMRCMPPVPPDPIAVFDRRALRRRRDRAAARDKFDFLFAEAAEQLLDRLDDVSRKFPRALDLGCRDGIL